MDTVVFSKHCHVSVPAVVCFIPMPTSPTDTING